MVKARRSLHCSKLESSRSGRARRNVSATTSALLDTTRRMGRIAPVSKRSSMRAGASPSYTISLILYSIFCILLRILIEMATFQYCFLLKKRPFQSKILLFLLLGRPVGAMLRGELPLTLRGCDIRGRVLRTLMDNCFFSSEFSIGNAEIMENCPWKK